MKILETEQGWAVEHNGKSPIAVEGESYFTDKNVLVAIIESKGRFVWADGSIEAETEDSSGAPPTEDPPTDPGAQPDDPDPNPVSPEPVTPKEDFANGGVLPPQTEEQKAESLARLNMHKGDNIVRPEFVKAAGGEEAVKKLSKVAKKKPVAKKAPAKKTAASAEDPAKPRRGRPPKYTPEEREKRRKEQAHKYATNRTEEQKALARERARRWRENNPDKVKEARQKSIEKRTKRYQEDPEYRQQFNEYQRTYKRSKREVAE